jgi:hypothetical protein
MIRDICRPEPESLDLDGIIAAIEQAIAFSYRITNECDGKIDREINRKDPWWSFSAGMSSHEVFILIAEQNRHFGAAEASSHIVAMLKQYREGL